MKIAIVGSRTFSDWNMFLDWVYRIYPNPKGCGIVSGGARGADAFAKKFAEDNEMFYREFPADWKSHGKKAGILRNEQIAQYCDEVLAFWDGKSPGTKNMIYQAVRRKKPIYIITF